MKNAAGPVSLDAETMQFDVLKTRVWSGAIVRDLARYRQVTLRTTRLAALTNPFATAAIIRAISHGGAALEDDEGAHIAVGPRTLGSLAFAAGRDLVGRHWLMREVVRRLNELERPAPSGRLDEHGTPVYLRTDLWLGVRSGGSVGHIAGVLNQLDQFLTVTPILMTTDVIPTVRPDLQVVPLPISARYWDFPELPALASNALQEATVSQALRGRRPAFVYQRYSLDNYVGVGVARRYGVPLVLEYNGSEVWIGRNWGRRLRHEALSERIELANLTSADLVVVVSEALRAEIVGRGVEADRILVNPNGVDTDAYRPDLDGSAIRDRYGLGDAVVIGFIGTFGPWHGAEVLAKAYARLIERRPDYAERTRLLMIGDGDRLAATRRIIEASAARRCTTFTGRTTQSEGALHLAACDILAAPHVPNPDGTPFFGSPTKLFEYMAMGRGIVASRLDQIGDVLDDGRTALLVDPGNEVTLGGALGRLVEDPALRRRLGEAAREDAVAKHTWREHTRRIVEALRASEAAS